MHDEMDIELERCLTKREKEFNSVWYNDHSRKST